MAGNIKGITIEFRGDTTRLDKALRQVNNETRNIDKELRNVDKALKFNPTSVDLWRQKQTLLTQKISETKDKLSLLKQQQKAMDDAGVDKQSLEYQKLQREIIETESKLKTFKGQLKQVGNVKLKAASEQFKQWGTSLENAGRQMQGLSMAAAGVVASLGAISYKAGQSADDINTMSKVYGIGTADLQKYSAAADLVDVDLDTIAKTHQRLTKAMSGSEDETGAQAEAFEKLGVSVTDSNGKLRNSDEVWQDTIKALGEVGNETERDALAMTLMGKSAQELNPLIEDGGKTYENMAKTMQKYGLEFVDQETLDAANEFNNQLDTMKMIGAVALTQVGSKLAGFLVPALEKLCTWVGRLASWLSSLSPEVLTVIGVVAGVFAAVAPVLIVLGKLAFAVSSLMSLASTLGVTIGALAGPIGIAIAAIAAIIAIGVLLYKNWDLIKAKAKQLWTSIKTTFNGIKTSIINAWKLAKNFVYAIIRSIYFKVTSTFSNLKAKVSTIWNNIKEAITKPIQTAKDKVKGIIDKLKSYFPIKVGNLLGHIKLPHFKITGEFSIKNKTVPHLSIEWYKKGGIFSAPSVIGVGEAGPEAVVPLDKLWEKLDNMGGGIVINVYGSDGMSVKQLADEVQRRLIEEQKRRRLAWQ